jgi:CRISPR system Cascade subunit CasA
VPFTFNLIHERWIPCTAAHDGAPLELSLAEVLERAHEIGEIADSSPLVTAALHRLLLALLHRNFGPADEPEWQALWNRRRFDSQPLDPYFQRWQERLDLFHPDRPFYQCGSLDFAYEVPVSKLAHEFASGNNPTLFDHTTEETGTVLSPAQAARCLVAHQAFAVGGRITFAKGEDPKFDGSADSAPLVKGAVALVKGTNLFETLLLNLHRYSRENEEPFTISADDAPAWERNRETGPDDRFPTGYVDLLTWQSRRIRLHPERGQAGNTVVRKVVIMKGNQFPDGWSRHGRETMLAFRKALKPAKGMDPWPAIAFQEDRVVWRDSLALFQSVEEQQARPKSIDWLNEVVASGILDRSLTLSTELFGLCSYRATVLFWRHERLPLPLAYLSEPRLIEKLRLALQQAEEVASGLQAATYELGKLLLAAESDRPGAPQPDKKNVRALLDSMSPARVYWSRLEVLFARFLVDLAADVTQRDDGSPEYGNVALPTWELALRRTSARALAELTRSLDSSARSLKAAAMAERSFYRRLAHTLPNPDKQEEVNRATAQ